MASSSNPLFGTEAYTSPQIGTPSPTSLGSPSDSGGILGGLSAGALQGLSNIGLQWYAATTKGVASPVIVPQPVQATPSAAIANTVNQLTSYLPLIILAIAALFLVYFVMNPRRG
jgi:hypothetical protein